jgi:hypothetical protein
MVTYKVCNYCEARYPATLVFFQANGKGKLKAKCRPCQKEYNRIKQKAHRDEKVEEFCNPTEVENAEASESSAFTQQFIKSDGSRIVTFLKPYPREIRSQQKMRGYSSSLANIMEAT